MAVPMSSVSLQIKQLLFGEGLTLAGARRRLDEERARVAPAEVLDSEPVEAVFGQEARERIKRVRQGLQSILDLLAERGARGRR